MAHAGTLAIRGLNKQYEVKGEALPVLQDINLTIEPGEFVSIVGSSGCGKSTLLRLVIGLEGDYKGEILLNGQRIVGTSLNRGIVFQEHRLFPWLTVEKNVALGLLNSSLTEGQQRATVREHIALVFTAVKDSVLREFSGHPAADLAEPPLKRGEQLAPAAQWQFAV